MMKKICKTVCLGLALSMLALPMVGCEKDPGLYAWYGGKMDVDNVMSIHVNGAEGEKVYDVSFDTYRTVFVYLKNNVSDIIMNDKGEATALSTNEEKNLAIKEVAEDILTEYYAPTRTEKNITTTIRKRSRITSIKSKRAISNTKAPKKNMPLSFTKNPWQSQA